MIMDANMNVLKRNPGEVAQSEGSQLDAVWGRQVVAGRGLS